METSKIYQLVKEIKKCESKISALIDKKKETEKELEKLLKKNFYRLRDFIASAIYEELGDEQKQKIDLKKLEEQKKEEQRKFLEELGMKSDDEWLDNATTYSLPSSTNILSTNIDFDPFVDQFEIRGCTLSDDKKNVKIRVECIKNRQYLGITGCWIPFTYDTGWIPMKKLLEYEK